MRIGALPIVALCLSACGYPKPGLKNPEIGPPRTSKEMPDMPEEQDVRMLVSQFYADAAALGKNVAKDIESVYFVDSFGDEPTVGQCVVWSDYEGKPVKKEVKLLRTFWQVATPQTKRSLVYHELGHCALNLGHTESGSGSIMEPTVLDDNFASWEWFGLVKNLFDSSALGLHLAEITDGDFVVVQQTTY